MRMSSNDLSDHRIDPTLAANRRRLAQGRGASVRRHEVFISGIMTKSCLLSKFMPVD